MSLRDFQYIRQEFALEHEDIQILKIDQNSQTNSFCF